MLKFLFLEISLTHTYTKDAVERVDKHWGAFPLVSRSRVPSGGFRGGRIGPFVGHHAESGGAVDKYTRLSRLRGAAAGLLVIKNLKSTDTYVH